MQKPNETEKLEELKTQLKLIHGEPPCFHVIDVITVKAWSPTKREETLAMLRANLARAESLVEAARIKHQELYGLPLPSIVFLQQIREDLEAYESVFNFVKSLPVATPRSSYSVPTSHQRGNLLGLSS